MDNKLVILFFASVILSGVQSAVNVKKNHESITVKEGDSYDLLCEATDVDVKACAFITPYGQTYVLWPAANYENGRIKQKGDGKGQCGITVNKAKDTDNGEWQCNLSIQDQSGNAMTEIRGLAVTVAVPPTKVELKIEETFSPKFYSVKMKQNEERKELAIDCIAEKARPKPIFEWYLGGAPLKGTKTPNTPVLENGKADYIETLRYYPDSKHDEKKLSCKVVHEAYTEVQLNQKDNEAEVLLKIQYAPIPPKTDAAFYDLKLGKANPIKLAFSANPKPTEGFWMINNTKVQIGTKSKDNKYTSGQITMKDGVQGQWFVELTIDGLTKDDIKGTHSLTLKNEEGQTAYPFKLALGKQPEPGNSKNPVEVSKGSVEPSNSLTVGIIVIIVIIVLILVLVIVARAKGIMCFAAAKGGDELEEEKEAFGDVEKGEANAIVQDSKPVENKGTPEKKLDQEVDTKAEKEEKKSNGAHTPV